MKGQDQPGGRFAGAFQIIEELLDIVEVVDGVFQENIIELPGEITSFAVVGAEIQLRKALPGISGLRCVNFDAQAGCRVYRFEQISQAGADLQHIFLRLHQRDVKTFQIMIII